MLSHESSIRIDAKPKAVHDFISDPSNLPLWLTSCTEVRNITGEGVGQTYEWTYRMAGVPLRGKTTRVEDAPMRIGTHTEGGAISDWKFQLEEAADHTKLTIGVAYTVPVPVLGKLAEKLVHARNVRELESSLENIKALLEQ